MPEQSFSVVLAQQNDMAVVQQQQEWQSIYESVFMYQYLLPSAFHEAF